MLTYWQLIIDHMRWKLEPIMFLSPLEEDYLVQGMEIQGFGKSEWNKSPLSKSDAHLHFIIIVTPSPSILP